MKKNLNQKLINLIEYYNLVNANLLLSETAINRNTLSKQMSFSGSKIEKLNKLKKQITLIYGIVIYLFLQFR